MLLTAYTFNSLVAGNYVQAFEYSLQDGIKTLDSSFKDDYFLDQISIWIFFSKLHDFFYNICYRLGWSEIYLYQGMSNEIPLPSIREKK